MSIWKKGSGGGSTAAAWGSITGTLSAQTDLQSALDTKAVAADVFSFVHRAKNIVDNIHNFPADTVLSTTGSTDLQTAITAMTAGQVLEVATNATYDPVTIPATDNIIIRAAAGYNPKIAGDRCIRISNGCNKITISGFTIENATNGGGNNNYTGTAVTFGDHQAIVENIILHNLTIKETTTGSSILLSYHWSVSGDNYANPPQLSELSNNVAIIGCSIYRGCLDGTEGACILLRGMKNAYIANNFIDNNNDAGRGIMLQGVLSSMVENNTIYNIGGGNAEAIKIDQIGTSPFLQTGIVQNNYTDKNIEGIDIDDNVSALVINNVCRRSDGEGISLDDSSQGSFIGNTVFNCRDGIRFEAGSLGHLANNNAFNCLSQNYRMDNAYVPDNSNVELSNRYIWDDFYRYRKTLIEGVAVNFLELYVSNNKANAIKIRHLEEAINSSTDTVETHYGEFYVLCRNQNGVITNTNSEKIDLDLPIGSGITVNFGVTNGTGKVTVNLQATSGITPDIFNMFFDVKVYGFDGYDLI